MYNSEFSRLIEEARARDARDIARLLMGDPDQDGHPAMYRYHRLYGGSVERTPSLAIYENGFKCFSATWADDPKGSGSGIDLWMIYHDCDFKEAVYGITGNLPPVRRERASEPAPPPPPRDMPTWGEVRDYARQRELALPYFHEQRAISVPTIEQMLFGADTDHLAVYHFSDGHSTAFHYLAYSIPNIAFGELRAINFRRDDASCRASLERNPALVQRIRVDLEKQGKPATLEDIVDTLFKRYKAKGKKGLMFNADLLGHRRDDGRIIHIPRPSVAVVEGELDATSGREHGYVTVTYPRRVDMATAFAACTDVVFIADNDPAGQGLAKATAALQTLGYGRIVLAPPHAKDLNALAQIGELDAFMRANRIPPSPDLR